MAGWRDQAPDVSEPSLVAPISSTPITDSANVAAECGNDLMFFLGGRMRFTDVLMHGHRRAGLAMAALVLPGLLVASAATAAASPVAATAAARVAAAATHAGKPVPVRPPSSPGAGTGTLIPAKPHGLRENSL